MTQRISLFKTIAVLCTAILIIMGCNLYAQKDFSSGFILKETGEQIWGEVAYSEIFASKKVYFKKTKSDSIEVNTVEQLKGFMKISNGDTLIYQKAQVTYGATHLELINGANKLLSDSNKMIRDTVFLQLIIGGKVNLYYLEGARGYYFYRVEGDTITELRFRNFIRYKRLGRTLYQEELIKDDYIIQLLNLFGNCSSIIEKLRKSTYTANDLRTIFIAYNECNNGSGSYYVSKVKKLRVSATFTAFAGFNSTWLAFKGAFNNLGDNKFKAGLGYTAGLGVRINLKKTSEGFGIKTELAVTGYKSHGSYSFYYTPYNNYKVVTDFNLLHLKAALLPEYTFGKANANFAPYINAGFVLGYAMKVMENKQHVEGIVLLPVNKDQPALNEIRKIELGCAVSLGLKMYRYAGLELRYEYGNGISYRSIVSSHTNSLMLTARFFYK